jgi:hypothetical protein
MVRRLSKLDKMILDSSSLSDFVHSYSGAFPKLSKSELAKNVARLWLIARPTLSYRVKHTELIQGNGKKKVKHDISEIFRK